jgi:alpha-glucoside transport system ATP-binding protein
VAIDGGGSVTVAVPAKAADVGATVKVGVRPEDLVATDGPGIFAGQISIVEALGETTLLYFHPQGGGDPIIAKLPGIHKFERGQTVQLATDPRKLHLFDATEKSYLYR